MATKEDIKERLYIWKVVTLRGWWKMLSGICFLAGIYDLIRSESSLTLPSLQSFISWWDWKIWLLIALFILLLAALEGSYHFIKKIKSELEAKISAEIKSQRRELRQRYGKCLDIPELLGQIHERAKELVISDNKKEDVIAKLPEIEKTFVESGYLSPDNPSLKKLLQSFAKLMNGGVLLGNIDKIESEEIASATLEVRKPLIIVQGAFDAQNVGALRLVNNDPTCKQLLVQIDTLRRGLPIKIYSEIDTAIYLSTAVANLLYFDFSSKIPPQFKTILAYAKPAIDFTVSGIHSRIASLIEAFLLGEDMK